MGKHSHDYTTYLRAELEAEIERLIALCDALDGDADDGNLDEDFEPSLGCRDDLEHDPAELEPWLGWAEKESLGGRISWPLAGLLDAELNRQEV